MTSSTLAALAPNQAAFLASPRKSPSRIASLCNKPGYKHIWTLVNPALSPETTTHSSTVSTVAFLAPAASTAEHLDIETNGQDGLDSEIAMLRIVTRRVLDLSNGVEDLETAFKLLALLS